MICTEKEEPGTPLMISVSLKSSFILALAIEVSQTIH